MVVNCYEDESKIQCFLVVSSTLEGKLLLECMLVWLYHIFLAAAAVLSEGLILISTLILIVYVITKSCPFQATDCCKLLLLASFVVLIISQQ